ncbi:hypothetical protein V8C42DRAFT_327726 [Trichoderma barbatum]
MEVDNLQEGFDGLNLTESEYLPFRPLGDIERCSGGFGAIPRYLFRVFSPYSQGLTNMTWAKSMAATNRAVESTVDIFSNEDKTFTAKRIGRHLRWRNVPENNLVSWTSSVLRALVYIFHLRAKTGITATLDQIHFCVIDTSDLSEGAFILDLDLIRAYRSYDADLRFYENLYNKKLYGYSGYYYFGEYFSQGALKIEGRCQIVSVQDIIDRGLYTIRSEFQEYADWERRSTPPWADPVIEMREPFYRGNEERETISKTTLQAAFSIADLFGDGWKLPIAAHLVALAVPKIDRDTMMVPFREFPDCDLEKCSALKTKIVAYVKLPEVQEYDTIMKSIYRDYCLIKLKTLLEKAEFNLREATIFKVNECLDTEERSPKEKVFTMPDVSWKATLNKLRTISVLSDTLCNDLVNRSESNFVGEDKETREESEK